MWNCHSWLLDVSTLGGPISQSKFVCQFWCTGIQGISALLVGGPSAKVCSSANCCVPVLKASILGCQGGHQPKKVHLPSIVYHIEGIYSRLMGGPSAKEGSSAKFELTCCFMLCFTCLFVLHTKDLKSAENDNI